LLSVLLSIVTFVSLSFVFPKNTCAVDITLAWDANTEPTLDGYRVFYRQEGDSYKYNHPDWAGGCTETTCTIHGLDDNTRYYFVARAVDDEGNESADSNEVCYQPNVVHTQGTTTDSDTAIYDDDRGDFGGGCFVAGAANTLGWEEGRL
jgi:hypothetical protein